MNCVLGLDFGTDSVRALICDAFTGSVLGQAVSLYPRWKEGRYCDPSEQRFRQHPLDYLESMEEVINKALKECPEGTGALIRGISVDTTGSTPVLADKNGLPLGLKEGFADNPNALFILWKDHTSVEEAADINRLALGWPGLRPTAYVGGIYSSEWFWAKALHVFRTDSEVRSECSTIMEHCDWIPAVLTDVSSITEIKRSRCAAGHKALWSRAFGGYPDRTFFTSLHPDFGRIYDSLGKETFTSDMPAGRISPDWAERLEVSPDCVVGVGAFDAHMGAVGAGVRKYQLAKVMGTSTCDILVAPQDIEGGAVAEGREERTLVRGICGQVEGSVIPGLIGYEAGQSAFGDVYAWFRDLLLWPAKILKDQEGPLNKTETESLIRRLYEAVIPALEEEAKSIDPLESGVIALDWLNGRRTPDANQALRGGIMGIHLGTDAPRIYRALIEATAYGAKAITDRFREEEIPIESVIALGGVSQKSELVMQITADVFNMDVSVSASEQACALGAAMFAAVAAGVHPDVETAQDKMAAGFSRVYTPRPEMAEKYKKLYSEYRRLGECEETLAIKRRKI